MSNKAFFDEIRRAVFGGSMTAAQVDGVERIIDYRDSHYRGVTNDQLAYVLATCFHETARKMCPCREMGGEAYLRSKRYYPWVGMGLVQLTWARNFARYGITEPKDALTWPVALHVCFDGMVTGKFTGRKLSDYISGGRVDFIGARRIINGSDRASVVAGYARSFQHSLRLWQPSPAPPQATPAKRQKGFLDEIGDTISGIFGSKEEQAAASGAPMPPPMPAALTGEKGYILAAVTAAVGALQLVPWVDVVAHPDVGYSLVATAVGTAVARAVLPTWIQWLVLRDA